MTSRADHPLAAVLFDMDGTLVDTEELWWDATRKVAATLGHELAEADLAEVLGRPVAHTAEYLRRVSGTSVPAAGIGADLDREFVALVSDRIVPRPGALELLDKLRAGGVPVALVTASPRSVVDVVLRALGPERFAVTVTADDTARTKPAPDPYLAAARALGVPASHCVAVEDTPVGVASAEAAGCALLVVPSTTPIPPAPGRTVLESLAEADLALLREIAAAPGPRFVVPSLTTHNGRVGDPFTASVSGLCRGFAGQAYAKAGGPGWAEVSADGVLSGVPDEPGTAEIVVSAGGTAHVTVRVPVVEAGTPLVRELRVMTWNLWFGGTKVDDHRDKQLRVVCESNVDIVALQETFGDSAADLAGRLGWHHHRAGANLGVISRYPIIARHGSPDPGFYGATGATIRLEAARELVLWSAHLNSDPYGPYDACFDGLPVPALIENESRSGRLGDIREILAALAGQLATADDTPVLLAGDFNAPSHLDWTAPAAALHGGYGPIPWPVTQAAEDAGLRDSFRVRHPDPVATPGVTWSPVHTEHEDGSGRPEPHDRIDYILYAGKSLRVLDSTTLTSGSTEHFPDVRNNGWPSDHAAVVTTFAFD